MRMSMMSRMELVRQLRREGWVQDRLCAGIQLADESLGGPTYMRDPNGRYFAVDEDGRLPLRGSFRSREVEGGGREHRFEDGRLHEAPMSVAEA
jgi:hypothetical protein